MKFRKKPVEIEAIQWTGHNANEIERFAGKAYETWMPSIEKIAINTLEGEVTASVGDWIVRGTRGEFYPCKPDAFDDTFEPVEVTK